mmetsp:Transcript_15547/g.48656  ORF Transcript_15547/g.48656 Transcript_15547/m.48656 type:complete len:249 (+) Transcript_15547:2248-2994(+)
MSRVRLSNFGFVERHAERRNNVRGKHGRQVTRRVDPAAHVAGCCRRRSRARTTVQPDHIGILRPSRKVHLGPRDVGGAGEHAGHCLFDVGCTIVHEPSNLLRTQVRQRRGTTRSIGGACTSVCHDALGNCLVKRNGALTTGLRCSVKGRVKHVVHSIKRSTDVRHGGKCTRKCNGISLGYLGEAKRRTTTKHRLRSGKRCTCATPATQRQRLHHRLVVLHQRAVKNTFFRILLENCSFLLEFCGNIEK